MPPPAVHASKPVKSGMHTEYFWHAYHPEMELWCQKLRLLLRKTHDPSRILLWDFLHILAILFQPERISLSISSLIHRSSGFFHEHLFYNAWRGQLQCIWWNLARIYQLHCLLGHGHGLFLHRWCLFIEDWEFPTIDLCLISSGCWMWAQNPK